MRVCSATPKSKKYADISIVPIVTIVAIDAHEAVVASGTAVTLKNRPNLVGTGCDLSTGHPPHWNDLKGILRSHRQGYRFSRSRRGRWLGVWGVGRILTELAKYLILLE